MDFTLSEEQRQLQERAYRFAVEKLGPLSKKYDQEEKFTREVVRMACEAGLVGCFIPKQYGGPGYGSLEVALAMEQVCRIDMGLGMAAMGAATFGSENIVFFGTEEQKRKYLPRLVKGELLSAGAYTEPDSGTDVVSGRTTAIRQGDEYVVNGSKIFITNGTVCDYMITFCITSPEAENRYRRHSLVLIEADRKGITKQKIAGKMGIRATDTAEISFKDVHVPRENLIGQEGMGFYHVMHFFDVTRTMVAAQGVGVSQGALDRTVKYVQEKNFKAKPLSTYQRVQFLLAEMATKIELIRNITYKAAWKVDRGEIDPKLNAMAKYISGEMAVWVCDMAVRLHGEYGYQADSDIQRSYRDAKILEIYEGAKEAEKLTIARRLF
ncbi:Acyl-CoA dehydrogenase [uncultured Desulfobacterium sp.]|uniref:Acyl-CoA dehydrogenase n=1 Tax=uncultured Desulfobacterium sp. TaxID=201089 RepID=A0A445MTM2_9BACT|nr:Acyl-CoA dehydrogenase [uncultured Desulfobacterium sp.]